jgi:Metallo-beta-lactamase superfamily
MYHSGEGVMQDDTEAVMWYGKAAEQGHASSQFRKIEDLRQLGAVSSQLNRPVREPCVKRHLGAVELWRGAEFAKLSTAPVRAIIYTHSHPDHTGGGGVFAGNDHPEILAHRLFVERVPDVGRNGRVGGDQFGSTLPDALFINAGTGMQFGRRPAPIAYVPPSRAQSV